MNKTRLNARINWLLVAVLSLFFTGCQGGEENGTASVRLSFNLSSSKTGAAKTASAPAPSGITSVRIDVTGPGMELLSDSVAVNSGEETVVDLEIPAGPARRFVVTAFDSEEQPRFIGETTVDLEPGTSPTIRIAMVEIDVVVPPILAIQITPTSTILTRSEPETFMLTNATTTEVSLSVVGETSEEAPDLGQITDGETPNNFTYTAPDTIPIDRTQTQIGVPIPITIEAVDNIDPDRRAQATVKLVTGPQLQFGPNFPVTPTPGFVSTESSGQRSVAFYNGKVYAVWANCPEGCFEILFAESSDGINWTDPPVVVASNNGVADPSLAVSSDGSVYVAYVVCSFCTSPSPTIQLAVRPFGETTFKPLPLTMIGTSPQDPTVAVAPSGIAFVAWSDVDPDIVDPETRIGRNIYLQRVPIDTEPKPINTDQGEFDHSRPAISISNTGEVFVAWEVSGFLNNNFFDNIAATASTDRGATFFPPAPVNDPTQNTFGANFSPTIAAGPQGTVYVSWEFDSCGYSCDLLVYFAKGEIRTEGLVFSQNFPLGDIETSPDQDHPSIAWDGANGIYVVFREQFDGSDQLMLAKSINEGNTFTYSPVSFSGANSSQSSPSVAVDTAGRVFAIWTRRNFITQGPNEEVFFSMGDDFQFSNSETSLLTRSASVSQ